MALFVHSAQRVQVGFELRVEERPWVARIRQLVVGMPLAIELAAAWVSVLTCPEIAQEIFFLSSTLKFGMTCVSAALWCRGANPPG